MKFWLDRFLIEDLKNVRSPIIVGYMDLKDILYKFYDSSRSTALTAQMDERIRLSHE